MKLSRYPSLIRIAPGILLGWSLVVAVAGAAPLSLDTLVSGVLKQNPELEFYRAEIAAAKGERRDSAALQNPELSAELGRKQVRSGGLSDEGLAWSISARQTFEWPGRLSLRKAIANQQVQLAELGLRQFESALTARARTLGFQLIAAREKASAVREVAERFQQLREVLVQRDPAGLTPLLETRIIEATELTLHRRASEAALAAQSALLELNQLRGAPWEESIAMDSVQFSFAKPPERASLLAAARTNNFELRMRQAELEQQSFRVSLAQKDGLPSVTVGPYFSQEKAGERERQIGLSVSLPLPLWNRNKGTAQAASARQQQAGISLLVTQRDVERRVVEAALTYDSKLVEMEKWRSDSVDEFRKAAELADRHYRLGAVPIATYVELQKEYLEAVEALLETKKEALAAVVTLEWIAGLPTSLVTMSPITKEAKP